MFVAGIVRSHLVGRSVGLPLVRDGAGDVMVLGGVALALGSEVVSATTTKRGSR